MTCTVWQSGLWVGRSGRPEGYGNRHMLLGRDMGTEDGSGPAEATCLASQCCLCGCVSLDPFSVGTAQYLRCRECGLVSRCPSSLLDSEICDLYGSDYYSDSERYPDYAEQPE